MRQEVRTIGDLLNRASEDYPDSEAIIFQGERITYRQLRQRADLLARSLLQLGVQAGDKVGIWMTNRPEWVYSEFAIAKVGATMVPLYTRLGRAEVEYILRQADVKVLIVMDRFLKLNYVQMLGEICPELPGGRPGELEAAALPLLRAVICLSTSGDKYPGLLDFKEAMESGAEIPDAELAAREATVEPGMVFNIPFTAGTTGFPKGVMTAHNQYLQGVKNMAEVWEITAGDRFLGNNPWCFNLGNMGSALMAVMYGATMVPMEAFDVGEALHLIQEEECSVLSGFATTFIMLLGYPDLNKYDTSSLRTGLIGLPNVVDPEGLLRNIHEKIGIFGLTAAYGMTENTGCTTMTRMDDPVPVKAYTVGKPLPGVEVKVVDPETGEDLPQGSEGELCTRGYLIMKGYYKMPEESARKLDKDGWFHTGDLALVDGEGNVRIKGRLTDMIKSGGISVYPGEIEVFLCRHPQVKDAQVVGIPDERRTEVPVAFIQLADGATCDPKEIISYCRGQIADYKIPKHVFFVEEYPLSSLGKIQKVKLREMAMQKLGIA